MGVIRPLILIGSQTIKAEYPLRFMDGYKKIPKVYVCKDCLDFSKTEDEFEIHQSECQLEIRIGTQIYFGDGLCVMEIDGERNPEFCRNLFNLASAFLRLKLCANGLEGLRLCYVLTKVNSQGHHEIVGYFSKEKNVLNVNVACICIFPPFRKEGYGQFLIALSYAISKKEGKRGTPSRPFSRAGNKAYKSYWTNAINEVVRKFSYGKKITIGDICKASGMIAEDVQATLKSLKIKVESSQGYEDNKIVLVPDSYKLANANSPSYKKRITFKEELLNWPIYDPAWNQ